MAQCRNLVTATIMLGMLFGVNGKYLGQRKAANGNILDPATSRFETMLYKNSQINKQKTNLSSPQMIQDFVFQKFKSEMIQVFTFLPKKYRCNILRDLMRTSHCNADSIRRILSGIIKNISKKCTSVLTQNVASKCSGQNGTKLVLETFWSQLGQLFSTISTPFQCSIVNKISSSSSSSSIKRRRLRQNHFLKYRAPRLSIQVVENELGKRYPFLNLKQNCSRVWKPLKDKVPPKSPAALVNVTVHISKRMKRKTWIRRFKRKAYEIYLIYHKFNFPVRRQRPLILNSQPTIPPLLSSGNVRLNIIKATKVKRSILAVFALEVKKPGWTRYKKVTSAEKIITPLQMMSKSAQRKLFGGNVVHLSGRKSDTVKEKYNWLDSNIKKAMRLFPKHLVSYYRSIDRLRRCLVMLYISSTLQVELRPVEMFYNSMGYASKKYFCSATFVHPTPRVIIDFFYRTSNNYTRISSKPKTHRRNKTTEKSLLTDTSWLNVTILKTSAPSETSDVLSMEPDESEEFTETKEVTPLEIGLFVVLALLCVAILVFTINCIIFALKKKTASSDHDPNTVFAQAIQLKNVEPKSGNKTENESHLQLTILEAAKLENTKKCCSSAQDLNKVPDESLENNSLQEVYPYLDSSTGNQYSEDPLISKQNLQKSSEHLPDDDTQTCAQNANSDQTDNDNNSIDYDDDDISDSDENNCSTDSPSCKIRTTRL